LQNGGEGVRSSDGYFLRKVLLEILPNDTGGKRVLGQEKGHFSSSSREKGRPPPTFPRYSLKKGSMRGP